MSRSVSLESFSETERQRALLRFQVVKPYLEDGVVLAKLAAQSSTGLAAIQITNYTGESPLPSSRGWQVFRASKPQAG